MLEQFCKDVQDALDYTVDFYRFLNEGETLQDVTVEIAPNTMTASRVEFDDRKVKVWLMGGVHRQVYVVKINITTTKNRRKAFQYRVRTLGEEAQYVTVSVADTTVLTGRLP